MNNWFLSLWFASNWFGANWWQKTPEELEQAAAEAVSGSAMFSLPDSLLPPKFKQWIAQQQQQIRNKDKPINQPMDPFIRKQWEDYFDLEEEITIMKIGSITDLWSKQA